jgi:Transcriptional regulator
MAMDADERTEGKKRAIMKAALEILTEKGYHPTTIEEIAERAGVGKGTVYLYFKSKLELVAEVIDTVVQTHLQEMKEQMSTVKGALEKLLVLAGIEYTFMRRHGPLAQILGAGEVLGLAPEFRSQMCNWRQRYIELIEGIVEEGQREGVFRTSISPFLAATIIFGARLAILQLALETDLENRADEVRNQVLEFVLHGLGAPV